MPRTGTIFDRAAARVIRRLAWTHALSLLARTAPFVCGALLLAMIAARLLGSYTPQTPWIVAVVLAWLTVIGAWAWLRRLTPIAALAVWDQHAQRHEAFVSAWWFESQPTRDAAQHIHLQRARAMLDDALPQLSRQLPAPLSYRAYLPPLLLLVLAFSGAMVAPVPCDLQALDADAVERARLVGQEIADKQKDLDRLKGMTPQEREKARQLQQAMSDTGDRMSRSDKQTPQEVLTQLETLAQQAEALAKAMAGESQPISSKMIEELERHADTAEFGAAVRATKADHIATEARQIGDRLKNESLTLDQRQRFEEALDKAMRAADDADKQSPVGRRLGQADRHMKDQQPREAGQRFDELAKEFEQLHERQQAAQRLQQLAQELRGGGQRIMQLGGGGIQQLAQAPGRATRSLQQMPVINGGMPMVGGMPMPGHQNLPVANLPLGHMPGGLPPIPGLGQLPGQGQCMMPNGGAPIPGTSMVGAGMMGQIPGGLQAGVGSAQLGNSNTRPHNPTGTATVAAAPVNPGESSLQAIEGMHHREDTSRAARAMAVEFIAAEEEALHAEPLPAARREQVLRYFTLLREQLEHADSNRN